MKNTEMKKILFLTPLFPFPPKDGFRARVFNMMRYLSKHYDITLLSFIRKKEKKHINDLSLYCDIFTVDREKSIIDFAKNFSTSLFSKKPLLVSKDYSKVFENKLKVLLDKNFDYIFFEGFHISQYLGCIKDSTTILDTHNPEHIILRYTQNQSIELQKLRNYELSQVKKFDKVITSSEKDAHTLGLTNLPNTHVIPNGCTIYDIDFIFKPNLLYVGSLDYPPNELGLLWFLQRVFPRLASEFPNIQFYIVGKNPSAKIKSFEDKNIKIIGFAEDLLPYYNKTSIFVVPQRTGISARQKILDAMSFKKCIVSTKLGAAGLEIKDNKNIFLADDHIVFINKLVGLLKNPAIIKEVAEKGSNLAKKHDWKLIMEDVRKIL